MIPYGRQEITQADIDAVVETLMSDYLTQGPKVPEFERVVAHYCGAKHAIALNSATSALHVACLALTLGPGDWLWTSPITFVASANCALYCGANVDFVDIDPRTYNLCPTKLEEKLVSAQKLGCLPKVVVAVHFSGQSCDMKRIRELSERFDFKVIEDASHAIGGRYKDRPIGGCEYSDITVFSFHPVKIITTAEGGMAVTNHSELAKKMAILRSHGIVRDPTLMESEADGGAWYYQQVDLGFNYRMTDIQASLGISQMTRLDEYVASRRKIADEYDNALANFPIARPWQHSDAYSSMHLYVVRVRDASKRKNIFDSLRANGIGVNVHYIPVHTQPFYRRMGFVAGQFPEAERYYSEAISLPIFPRLTRNEQEHIVQTLRGVLQ